MLYFILRPFVSFILYFFIKNRSIHGLSHLPENGPVLLAVNHPNSFLDAVIIACMLKRRVWSLARGDVFKKKTAGKILSSLFMLPIHRISEGRENMTENDKTFDKCLELFRMGEIVLIFSEGICKNQTSLLPLKKGTARLALSSWKSGVDLKVIPIGITYNTFNTFGKIVNINMGAAIEKKSFDLETEEANFIKQFNHHLTTKMTSLQDWDFSKKLTLYSIIYWIAYLFQFPIYIIATKISQKITKGSVFYDSIVLGILIALLPIYWFILTITSYYLN